MRFKTGDKVWAIVDARYSPLYVIKILGLGRRAAVVLGEVSCHEKWAIRDMLRRSTVYHIDIEGHSSLPWFAAEKVLEPRHDPYEGDLSGSWDTCPYQPERVTT